MQRLGILTAGGDTPALNATLYGAAERANASEIELYGIVNGFAGLLNPRVPHVHLNPLFSSIPELDPTAGGTLLGASRTYIDPTATEDLTGVAEHIERLGLDGLICVGGDGTINGMQPLSSRFPCVLAPKTIDNDLGLNYIDEPNEHALRDADSGPVPPSATAPDLDLEKIINYVTPGYATAVFVASSAIERIRTTAESHRRIAIIEVMGRQSGYIALGSAYGQPDIILIPEIPVDLTAVERRIRELYDLQQHVVIVVGEGVVDETGHQLGAVTSSVDPAGNLLFSGAAEALKHMLLQRFEQDYFQQVRPDEDIRSAIFTRKVGHTQRGGRPIRFDRFHAVQIGGKAVELLIDGQNNFLSTLQWSQGRGFHTDALAAHKLLDRQQRIHPRQVHPSLYDASRFQPTSLGIDYLNNIFTRAIGSDDMEHVRCALFPPDKIGTRYQSINIDIQRRLRTL